MSDDLSAKILEELAALRRTTEGLGEKQEELRLSLRSEIRQVAEELGAKQEDLRLSLRSEIRQSGDELRLSLQSEIRQSAEGLVTRQEDLRLSLQSEIRQVAQELGAKVDDSRREFGVITEGLRSEIQQVAEGVILNGERIDRLQAENAREFAEMQSMFRFPYTEHERRLRTLEDSSESHETRLQRLESAASH